MRRTLHRVGLALLCALAPSIALADRIHLKTGDYVDVDNWREENGQIFYERFGGTIAISKDDVVRIERNTTDPTKWQAPGTVVGTPSSRPAADDRPCANTVITPREVKMTEDAIDVIVSLGPKFRDVETRLRGCLDVQRRALRGEAFTREAMAAGCCAS